MAYIAFLPRGQDPSNVSDAVPTDTQYIGWNDTTKVWEPKSLPTDVDIVEFTKVGPFTTSATPGTRTTHAHTLVGTPTKVILQVTGTDADSDDLFTGVQYVKTDATNITVKAHVASTTFVAYVKL